MAISTNWGSVTLELQFGSIDYLRHATPHAKIGGRPKGVGWGMAEVVT